MYTVLFTIQALIISVKGFQDKSFNNSALISYYI